ncbi:MAG: carboxypeptidase regulatory-like domain-containing protein, partial [Acidimicrobiia bacterium]|nr:carboxypeptidase regulatory-like domain-containing protein [Acidimicrobiia bacterium]
NAAGVTGPVGDTNGDTKLSTGETWVFTLAAFAPTPPLAPAASTAGKCDPAAADDSETVHRNVATVTINTFSDDDPAHLCILASLGDRVWLDTLSGDNVEAQNGIQDPGEVGVAGVTVNLLNAAMSQVQTTGTDGNGNYSFTGLVPGDYYVQFVLPAGFAFSPQDVGGDDTIDSDAKVDAPDQGETAKVTLASGDNNPTIDAGIFPLGAGITMVKTTLDLGTPPQLPPLSATEGVDGAEISAGNDIQFTYRVSNPGLVALAVTSFIDDAGTPGDAADDFAPTYISGDVDNDGLLDSGETWFYGHFAKATNTGNNPGGIYENNATVVGNPVDGAGNDLPGFTDVSASDPSSYFNLLDLQITKGANPEAVVAGTPFVYTVTVTNIGSGTATDVVILDLLPARCNPGSAGPLGTLCPVLGQTDPPFGGAFAQFPQFNENTDAVGDPGFQIDLPALPDPLSERLQIQGATLNGALPASCVYDSAVHGVRCDIGDLAPLGEVTVSIPLLMDPFASVRVWNRAWVTSDETIAGLETNTIKAAGTPCGDQSDTDGWGALDDRFPQPAGPGCNYTKKNATVITDYDVSIIKQAQPATVLPGQDITYTMTVTHAGPSGAFRTVVTDTLPNEVSFVSATSLSGSGCTHDGSATGGTITCDVGPMLNSQTVVTVVATAAHAAAATCTNTATVTTFTPTGDDVVDSNPANNTAAASTDCAVQTQIDLELTKSVDAGVVPLGTAVTWTITVSNKGPANATGVTVSDQLPAGVTYVSDNGGGAFNAGTSVWTIGNLAVGASTSLQIVTTVDTQGPKINRAQVAAANETDIDSTPGNCPAVPAALSEDDCADAEVGTVAQATTTTVPDTLVKTGGDSASLAALGFAVVALGGLLVLSSRRRRQFDW